MKKTLLPVILILVLGIGGYFTLFYNPDDENDPSDPKEQMLSSDEDNNEENEEVDPDALEREQRLVERARPAEFVDLNYTSRRNLLNETIVEGSFSNNAELTMYSEFQLMVYFSNTEGYFVDSASQVVFEQIVPGETAPFKIKQKGPRKAGVSVKIIKAKADDIPKALQEDPA